MQDDPVVAVGVLDEVGGRAGLDLAAVEDGLDPLASPPEGGAIDAALCFADVDSTAFERARERVEAILDRGEIETGTTADFVEDAHGYHWVVLHDSGFEDLVTSVHFAADTLVEEGFGSRLLAALFAFERDGTAAYWVYSFRRGAYYPFVPSGRRERDTQTEFKLDSVLDGELTVEDDTEYWYPMWPEGDAHPWG